MSDSPCYPLTVYYKDTGEWIKGDEIFYDEMELIVGLEFADTDETDNNWAIKVIDKNKREVSLRIEAMNIERFEFK